MNAKLTELFGGKGRSELLRLLFLSPTRVFSTRELATQAHIDVGNATRWLNRWSNLGILRKSIEGRNVLYQVADDPMLKGLTEVFMFGDSLFTDLQAVLPATVTTAAVFGSVARGKEHAASDVDVLVLGPGLSSLKINAALRPVGRAHHREIHATVYTEDEFQQMIRNGNDFAQNVLAQKAIILKGALPHAAPQTQ